MKKGILLFVAFFTVLSFGFEYSSNGIKVVVATSIPQETVLTHGKTAVASDLWIEMIKSAEKTIDFSEFYLTGLNREPLKSVVKEIVNAAKRGVKIRFLVDRKMVKNSEELIKYFSKQPNIKITVFNWRKLTGGINHTKYFIVDGKKAFVGSQNFDWRALKHIHETGVMIEEPKIIEALSLIYNADWDFNNGDLKAYEKLRKKSVVQRKDIYLVGSPKEYLPKGVDFSLDELVRLINSAEKEITIQLLNYSTFRYEGDGKFETITNALKKAAKKGVKVRLLVSDWNLVKPKVESLKELQKEKGITVKYVHIPVSKEDGFIPYSRVIHSKVVLIDGKIAWVGTNNFAYDYFYKTRGVEVVLRIREIASVLKEMFEMLWNSPYSHVIEPSRDYKPPKIA